ncbi:scavenger receptor class B member 1-like [Cylas formicarius]|uniref:scavenger receptor class B member 1-like n=1 Tax=Cylas formicarius TaxID=197179 RepID=UPI0029583250|nr:scavenger receptor class B member 1-like [Cylas formicarius]
MDDIAEKFDSVNMHRTHSNLSNLEKNCSQIFVKGPALTKDFFDKIQTDMVPSKTDLFGYRMNTRRFLFLTGLVLLFTFSALGTVIMWFTKVYQQSINNMMTITEDSLAFDMWRAPSPRPYMKFFIFNYTNVEDYERRSAKKLHVEEAGPYVYEEQLERVNVRFNGDGTVSYQEKRTYKFIPELSKGSPHDLVTVPNVPVIAGAAVARNWNFFMRLSYSGLLKSLNEKPFITLTANSLIVGYEDHLYDIAKNYLKLQEKRVFDHVGLLVWKEGVQPDVITVNTGTRDYGKLGRIEKFNGQDHLDLWSSDTCNRLKISDGTVYPVDQVKSKKELHFFLPQLCRALTLKFVEESQVLDRVPVYKYTFPVDIFDNADQNGDHRCYCEKGSDSCGTRGVFNASACVWGAPIYYSWPYFYNADPQLRAAISGLKRNPAKPEVYVNIHPKLGVLTGGKVKFQVNIQMQKSYGISELNNYKDGQILPIVLIESGLDEKDLPRNVIELIYRATFTVRNLELGLKYGFLLASTVTLACILLVLKKRREIRLRANSIGYLRTGRHVTSL